MPTAPAASPTCSKNGAMNCARCDSAICATASCIISSSPATTSSRRISTVSVISTSGLSVTASSTWTLMVVTPSGMGIRRSPAYTSSLAAMTAWTASLTNAAIASS